MLGLTIVLVVEMVFVATMVPLLLRKTGWLRLFEVALLVVVMVGIFVADEVAISTF